MDDRLELRLAKFLDLATLKRPGFPRLHLGRKVDTILLAAFLSIAADSPHPRATTDKIPAELLEPRPCKVLVQQAQLLLEGFHRTDRFTGCHLLWHHCRAVSLDLC